MKLPASLTTVTLFSKLLAMVLFLTFILSAFLVGMKYQGEIDLIKYQQSNLVTTKSSITSDPTANWKTYTNTQYGFEIKYPTGYLFTNLGPMVEGVRIYSKNDVLPIIDFAFYENPDSMSVAVEKLPRTFRDLETDKNLKNIKEKTLKKDDAFEAIFVNESINLEENELYIYHNGHVYVSSFDTKYGNNGKKMFENILSTFKFIN